jgi:hypothetical protein
MSDKLTRPGCIFLFKWTLANTLSWALGLIAGSVGFLLPMLILMAVDSLIKLRLDGVSRIAFLGPVPGAAGGALLGACVGRAQQLVLRPHLPLPRQWVLASVAAGALGGAAGCTLNLAADLTAGGAVGLMLGFAIAGGLQYRILRERVARAGWWVMTNLAGGVLAFAADLVAVMAVTALAVRRETPGVTPGMTPGTLYARQMDAAVRQVAQIMGVTLGTLLGAALVGAILGVVLMVLLRQPRAEAPTVAASPVSPVVEKDKSASLNG